MEEGQPPAPYLVLLQVWALVGEKGDSWLRLKQCCPQPRLASGFRPWSLTWSDCRVRSRWNPEQNGHAKLGLARHSRGLIWFSLGMWPKFPALEEVGTGGSYATTVPKPSSVLSGLEVTRPLDVLLQGSAPSRQPGPQLTVTPGRQPCLHVALPRVSYSLV